MRRRRTRPRGRPRDQSIGELVKDLAGETSTLVRREIELAKAEMVGSISSVALRGICTRGVGSLDYQAHDRHEQDDAGHDARSDDHESSGTR
jgi:hypothetical protein